VIDHLRFRLSPATPMMRACSALAGTSGTWSRSGARSRRSLGCGRGRVQRGWALNRGRRRARAGRALHRCQLAARPPEDSSRRTQLKGFTEPVALSSPASADLPPSGLAALCVPALRSGFDLLALRTRCEGEGTRRRHPPQGPLDAEVRNQRQLCQSTCSPSCASAARRDDAMTSSASARLPKPRVTTIPFWSRSL